MCVCVCVCVCCHPIYSGRQTCGRTRRGHTGFLHFPSAALALIFIARRIQPPLSLVDREVELLCTHELIPVRVTAPRFELTSQRQKVSRLPTEPPGQPCSDIYDILTRPCLLKVLSKFCPLNYISITSTVVLYFRVAGWGGGGGAEKPLKNRHGDITRSAGSLRKYENYTK